MSREPNDTDEYTGAVTLDDILGVFDAVSSPVITAGDVAETVACSREMARRKLHNLEDRGDVASRKTADRVVWSLVDDHDPQIVHRADPFWEFEPGVSGESGVSERVDEVRYGEDST